MRKFLTNIKILGVTMAFREDAMIRFCLDDLIRYCDKVLIMLDNFNEVTKKIVLSYKWRYSDKVTVFYSKVARLELKQEQTRGLLKQRLNHHQGEIRDQVLQMAKEMYGRQQFDLLLWPDGDECFSHNIGDKLTEFWNSDRHVLFLRPITVFDSLKIIRKHTLSPHAKVFKYRLDMTALPFRKRGFYHPFKPEQIMRANGYLIHVPLISKESRAFRWHYHITPDQDYPLWFLENDVRKYKIEQIEKLLKQSPDTTVNKYLKDKYGDKRLAQ